MHTHKAIHLGCPEGSLSLLCKQASWQISRGRGLGYSPAITASHAESRPHYGQMLQHARRWGSCISLPPALQRSGVSRVSQRGMSAVRAAKEQKKKKPQEDGTPIMHSPFFVLNIQSARPSYPLSWDCTNLVRIIRCLLHP